MSTSNIFVISRTLNAPRDLVWQIWTQPEHLTKWFGPKGFTTNIHQMDLRPSGIVHYSMKTPEGFEMWGKWIYREICPPEKLVLVQHFSNVEGGVTRHPGSTTWPEHTLSTMTLAEQQDGKTLIQLEWQAYEATDEEVATFNSAFDSMTQGWSGTFEQLDNYLITITQ